MNNSELQELFDKQAPIYDERWGKLSTLNQCLYFLLDYVFAPLPEQAKILSVGTGTGKELIHLAQHKPQWQFTVVEPSSEMMQRCQQAVTDAGFAERCSFHQGYIESLAITEKHHAATCFLVSHFILNPSERSTFFQHIANQLLPEGLLASSDLCFDKHSAQYPLMLKLWMRLMSELVENDMTIEELAEVYAKDVDLLPAGEIVNIITKGGFKEVLPFYQGGMIQAFCAKKA